jgi:hypothetical protein
MDKIKQHNPGELASNEMPGRPAPEPEAAPFRRKFVELVSASVAVLGATGVVGSMVGAYFQQRAWNNEKAITKRQDDAAKVFDLEQKVSEFVDKWWAAADRIEYVTQSHANKEEWERAWGEYRKNFEEGQLNKWAAQIAFFVDEPFKRKTDDKRKEISDTINCLSYTLEPTAHSTIDSQSATHLLQIIEHCHDLSKQDIEKASAGKHPPASCVENEQNICHFHWRKSHIWWLSKVLRCIIFERAVAIRNDVAKTTWDVMPHVPSNYDLPQDAPDCVRDYHDDSHVGSGAKSEKQ